MAAIPKVFCVALALTVIPVCNSNIRSPCCSVTERRHLTVISSLQPHSFNKPLSSPPSDCSPNSSRKLDVQRMLHVSNGFYYSGISFSLPDVLSTLSDNPAARTLSAASFVNSTSMTIEACIGFCSSKSYIYSGVEYSQECCV
jgi:hypothetical protein